MSVEIGAIASQDEHEQQFGVHARRGHLILSQTPYSRIQTFAQEHVLDFSGTFSLTKVTAESANSPDWPDEINYKCTNIGGSVFSSKGSEDVASQAGTALHAGEGGRDTAANSGAVRPRHAALVDRQPGHSGVDGRV